MEEGTCGYKRCTHAQHFLLTQSEEIRPALCTSSHCRLLKVSTSFFLSSASPLCFSSRSLLPHFDRLGQPSFFSFRPQTQSWVPTLRARRRPRRRYALFPSLAPLFHPNSVLALTIPPLRAFISPPSQQHLLLQALHDELEEAAKGDEGGQAEMKDKEDEEKFWASVAAKEKRCV